jgi:hypothetical protein
MPLGDTTEFPERFLNAFTERLERFGETERDRFDVAVRQDAVKQSVIESHSGDLDPEIIADGEIACREPSGMMLLGKEDGLARSMESSPLGDPALESSPG